VACFSDPKNERQHTTIYHDSTTNSPAKNRVPPPVFAKTPSKNAQIALQNKRPDKVSIGPSFTDFGAAREVNFYWLKFGSSSSSMP
jgi:hypothetical protein